MHVVLQLFHNLSVCVTVGVYYYSNQEYISPALYRTTHLTISRLDDKITSGITMHLYHVYANTYLFPEIKTTLTVVK